VNLKTLFARVRLDSIKLNAPFLEADFSFDESDRDAAWDLYVEMLTRIVTQPLPSEAGDEETALQSVYSLFPITREILRHRGRSAISFSKIAVPVLNQIVRPFTAKWHRAQLDGAFTNVDQCDVFRSELAILQEELRKYNRLLAEIAQVEDLTILEDSSSTS
jgi:hypothetical protein